MVYSDEAIADGNHVDHLPIKVYAVEQRVVAINSPQSQRGIYRQAKRLFRRVEREIGMARARP
jgi:membrane-bound lytic murein transglycosylase B